MIWDSETASMFVNDLKDHMSPHYSVGITGSVLFEGSSSNDLDIIIYPKTTMHNDKEEMKKLLRTFGMFCFISARELQRRWKKYGHTDEKHVEKYKFGDLLVDVFYLS